MKCPLRQETGSVAMETVMVLPPLVIIIFVIIQLCLVWGAKQMVAYAAYCGARAALVYNPADYDAEKQKDGHWETRPLALGGSQTGVVHHAACTVLSWVSWSLTNDQALSANASAAGLASNALGDFRLGWVTSVPLSSRIRGLVRVAVSEFEAIDAEGGSDEADTTPVERQFPAVTVRVRFEFPLFIPLGGAILGYFFGARETHVDTTDAIGPVGFTAPGGETVHGYMKATGRYTEMKSGWGFYTIPLEESCTMAKPYKTDTYPRMSPEERNAMMLF